MNRETIAVVGGTGELGAPVVRRLVEHGYAVRLLVRDEGKALRLFGPEVDCVTGDVGEDAPVRRLLAGAQGVHISLSAGPDPASLERIEHRGSERVARLAREAGVGRITYLSGMYVGHPAVDSWADRGKAGAEAAIGASGVPHTIFKPSYFMETLPRQVRGRRAVVIGAQPHPFRIVAATDFGAMVARAFALGASANGSFYVFGPERWRLKDALGTYCRLLAPNTRVSTMPIPLMRVINRLFLRGQLQRDLEILRLLNEIGEVGDDGPTERVFGVPPTTLDRWCLARAGAV